METKKTIIVSIITTLATMLIVAVIMHMCCGNCGKNSSCTKATSRCEQSSSCKSESACAGKSKCGKEKSCSKSSCDKSGKEGKSCSMKMKDSNEMMMEKEIVNEEVKK